MTRIIRRTPRQVTGQPAVNYTYDGRGMVTGISDGGNTVNFTYDSRGAIAGVSRSNGVNTTVTSDVAGNIIGITHAKGASVLDSQSISYDSALNVTDASRVIGQTLVTQSASATYDAANRPLTFRLTRLYQRCRGQSNHR